MDWCWQGKTEVLGKNCPSATFLTTYPMWTGLGLNPGLHERLATSHLSDGTAKLNISLLILFNEQQYVVCFEYIFACSVKLEVTVMYMHMKCNIFIVGWLYQESDSGDKVEKVCD